MGGSIKYCSPGRVMLNAGFGTGSLWLFLCRTCTWSVVPSGRSLVVVMYSMEFVLFDIPPDQYMFKNRTVHT